MFVLIEVEDRSIKTLACGYSYEETKEKLKVRFAQCVKDHYTIKIMTRNP